MSCAWPGAELHAGTGAREMLTAKSGKTKLCQLRISRHVTCTVPACRSRSLRLPHHSTTWSARHSEMLCRPAPQLCPWGSKNTSFLQGFTRGLDSPSSDPAPEKQMPRFVSKRKQKTNQQNPQKTHFHRAIMPPSSTLVFSYQSSLLLLRVPATEQSSC